MACLPEHKGSDFRLFRHVLYLLAFTISAIFIGLVLIDSTPLTASRSSPEEVDSWPWGLYLVRVNETLTSTAPAGNANLMSFGFGVWGWCETKAHDHGHNPACVVKPFYGLPDCTNTSDPVTQLGLPYAITHALSVTGFLLIFPLIGHIVAGVIMLCSFNKPLQVGGKVWFEDAGLVTFQAIMFLLEVPVIITAIVGATSLTYGLSGALGKGAILLIVGISLRIAFGIPYAVYESRRFGTIGTTKKSKVATAA